MANHLQSRRHLQSLDDPEDAISSTNDGSQPISQNVQDLANEIYKEFESLIKLYGNGFLHNLMPLVIRALENLDSLHLENADLHLKSLVLSDDHKLLSSEYEKEKKLRKAAENKLFRMEDDLEEERKQHEERSLAYDASVRMLENKVKSLNEQISRFEDQEAEMKRDYQRLHGLYTNLLRAYLEYVERIRSMCNKNKLDQQCLPQSRYLTDNACFDAGLQDRMCDPAIGIDQLNRFSCVLDSDLETERQRIMRLIMETTPELYSSGGILNISTLSEPCFDELSQADLPEDDGHDVKSHDESCTIPQPPGELLGSDLAESVELDVDGDLTDYAGVRREVQNLIKENQELIQTKNALKVVTNDLIGRIDELSCQNFQFSSELNGLITNRASMLLRIKDLEQENGQLRREFENSDLYGSLPGDEATDCEELPLSMRVRFSRVEMARVLLERNQYKEQLLELQEAVHLAHNLKAQRMSKLQDGGNKRGRIKAFFARLFNSPQSQQNSSKVYTPSTSTSQPTTNHICNSSPRLSMPSCFTSSWTSERNFGNVSVSFQKTTSESCLNQDSEVPKTSAKPTYVSDSLPKSYSQSNQNIANNLTNHKQSTYLKTNRRTSPIDWFSHGNEYSLEERNPRVACIYPLDAFPDSIELRCAAAAYPHNTISSLSSSSLLLSSPLMDKAHSADLSSYQAKSVDNCIDSDTEVSAHDNLEREEEHQQLQIQSTTKASKKFVNNHSVDNIPSYNTLGYSLINDESPDIHSNIIWLCSSSMKQELAVFKAQSSVYTSYSSSATTFSSEYSSRIKSLITILRMDNSSCQLLDSFAICSSTVLCICAAPEASDEDFASLESTKRYWEMLPMDTFSDDSETGQSLNADISQANAKDHPSNTSESNIITEFKYLECDNSINCSTPERTNKVNEDIKYNKTPTPTSVSSSSHLSTIRQALDHLSSTRRLVNALGIVGSVNDVDEVTMSYVATRRRFLIRHLDCDVSVSSGAHFTEELHSHHSSANVIDDDSGIDSQYVCSSSTHHNQNHSTEHPFSSFVSYTSAQPTIWLGCHNGDLYVHSSMSEWRKCLHAIRLPDSITQICHFAGRVFVSLANGQIVVFRRQLLNRRTNNAYLNHSTSSPSLKASATVSSSCNLPDNNISSSAQSHNNISTSNLCEDNDNIMAVGSWDFTEACVITCGRPQCSVKCTITVPSTNSVWAAYRNRILVINAFTLQLVDCFKVHAIQDAQVQTMSWHKDGVWISIRRESILRLYHVISHELIQTVDLNQVIMNLLLSNSNQPECNNISSKIKSPSFAITTLTSMNDRLWIGTSVGLVVTIHFQDSLFNRTFQKSTTERQKDSANLSKRICKAILDCSSVQVRKCFFLVLMYIMSFYLDLILRNMW
ncbi:unnamed protein product [Heterobilharzia americana]|nr:unnamed protein product [Heterobilharzia americana]